MDAQIHGALVGGVLGGVLGGAVVFTALALERHLRRRDEEQASTVRAAAEALDVFVSAISRNVRSVKGSEANLVSGAQITGAIAQLIVLGRPEIAQRLVEFDRAGMSFATKEGQRAFLDVLHSVRTTVLPHQPPLDRSGTAELLFETNRVTGDQPTSTESPAKLGWRSVQK